MGWAIALHGGAGDISRDMSAARKAATEAALHQCLDIGVSALDSSRSALDAVELVVRELEMNPVFNAGRGSVLTARGTVEMEACIMDGSTKNCGAVSGVSTVIHPISLARLVMEKSPHVYLGFEGAEEFAREQGVKRTDPSHFITQENQERLERAQQLKLVQLDYTEHPTTEVTYQNTRLLGVAPTANGKITIPSILQAEFETVGCVAVDSQGNCAAATSTGGLVNKMVGRIGDTPLVGAGTYANQLCAVSATGRGEEIIKATIGRGVAAIMEYRSVPLAKAVDEVINHGLPKNMGGLVAISANGDVAMAFNTTGMFRASVKEGGHREVGILH